MTAPLVDLLHLVDRAERRVLLPEEAGLLRAGIRALAGREATEAREKPARTPEAPDPHRSP
jgi:hypothetical protein